jgi:hypothetical protein
VLELSDLEEPLVFLLCLKSSITIKTTIIEPMPKTSTAISFSLEKSVFTIAFSIAFISAEVKLTVDAPFVVLL